MYVPISKAELGHQSAEHEWCDDSPRIMITPQIDQVIILNFIIPHLSRPESCRPFSIYFMAKQSLFGLNIFLLDYQQA